MTMKPTHERRWRSATDHVTNVAATPAWLDVRVCRSRSSSGYGSRRATGVIWRLWAFLPWKDRLVLQLLGFIIDCPDPISLAAFYSEVTGRSVMEGSSEDFALISLGEVALAFQRVEDYRAPRWPEHEHPKQFHLDFEVDLIEIEQRRVIELGATLQKDLIGPQGYGWQVYTDPVGHPFCLCRHEGVSWIDERVAWG